MPTREEIERLTAQLARLAPLGDARPGELIRAEDWNALVGAVREVTRALTETQSREVEPHDHPDQVQLGWLDPRLRIAVQSGPLGDPANIARVDSLERADVKLRKELETLTAAVRQLSERVRELATRDLTRESSVNTVRRRVEGIADGREDVLAVRASLDVVRARVERAVKLGEDLQSDGVAVDLGALQERVGALEQLREQLTLPNGEPFDGSSFERRVIELRNELVDQQALDEALAANRAELDPAQEAALEGRVTTSLDKRLEATAATLRTVIEARTDERLAGVDQSVQRAVSDATPALTETIVGRAREEGRQLVAQALEQAAADARATVEVAAKALRRDLLTEVSGVRGELDARIDARIDARVPSRLDALRVELEQTREESKVTAARVDRTESELGGVAARMDELDRDTSGRLTGLRGDVDRGLGAVETRMAQRLEDLDKENQRGIAQREAKLQASVREQLASELTTRDAKLREQLAGIASDQVAGLEDRLPSLVGRHVESNVSGIVRDIAQKAVDEKLRGRQ